MRSRDWSDSNVTSQAPPTLSPIEAGKQASVVVLCAPWAVGRRSAPAAVNDDAAAVATAAVGVAVDMIRMFFIHHHHH